MTATCLEERDRTERPLSPVRAPSGGHIGEWLQVSPTLIRILGSEFKSPSLTGDLLNQTLYGWLRNLNFHIRLW